MYSNNCDVSWGGEQDNYCYIRSTASINASLFYLSDVQFRDQKVNIIKQQVTSATLI